ncbi:MAG: GNAT family N-acetyltransferase [Hyphomicrobiaceae bacterium]|nr:GNAT family N-acetyltransferase [Hyphomicrobiaceae bacterium]
MSITIRPLEKSDCPRWLLLWQGYLQFYETELPDEVTAKTWQGILSQNGGHEGLGALDATGKLIGFAHILYHGSTWSISDYCYLEDLFVDPDARHQGAGAALMAGAEKAARDRGCARLYLTTAEQNHTARRLYDQALGSAGFVRYAKAIG